MTFGPVPFPLHCSSRHGLLVFWKSSQITTQFNCLGAFQGTRDREPGRERRSARPAGGARALCPGWTQAGAVGLVRVRPRKLSCHWPERRGRQPIRSASVSTLLGWGARGNLKWLTGCWRLASWGPRRWGRSRSARAGPPKRKVSARRAGPGSRLRRGAWGLPDAGVAAAARVPDVRVGRHPGRLPFSPPRPTAAPWGLQGVGPGRSSRTGCPHGLPGLEVPLRLRGQRR